MTKHFDWEKKPNYSDPFKTNPRITGQRFNHAPSRQQRDFYKFLYSELCEKRGYELPQLMDDWDVGMVHKCIRKAKSIMYENDIRLPRFNASRALMDELKKDGSWTVKKKDEKEIN